MTVEDPSGNFDTQTFTIGGLLVSQDTYFVFYSDTSGSMQTQIRQIAQLSSVPLVYSRIIRTNTGTGTTTLNFGPTSLPCPTTCNNTSGRVRSSSCRRH